MSARCVECGRFVPKGWADLSLPGGEYPYEHEDFTLCKEHGGPCLDSEVGASEYSDHLCAMELRRIARASKRGVTFGVVCGPCAYCGDVWSGSYAIHRDGFGKGPEVPLCDRCGVGRGEPSLDEIWWRVAQPIRTDEEKAIASAEAIERARMQGIPEAWAAKHTKRATP